MLVGCLCVVFINGFMKPKGTAELPSRRGVIRHSTIYTVLFFLMLLVLAAFRKVSLNVGGTDAPNYISNFLNIDKGGMDRSGNVEMEWGFQTLTRFVRSFTDDYRVYFAVIYGIIVFGYIKFIKCNCPKGLVYIPFLLLMYPFFRSFNTVRTSVAIAFILMGLSYIDKSKWKSFLLIAVSVLFHRMSLLFVFVWPFYYLMQRYSPQLSRKKFVIVSLMGIAALYLISLRFQQYAIAYEIMDGADVSYIQDTLGQNYLMRYPMFFGQLLLLIMLTLNYNSIQWNSKTISLRTLFIYDLWMIPAGLVLGMWRSIEYLYLVRLSLWAVIIYTMAKKQSSGGALLVKICSFCAFVFWLVLRVYKEYEPCHISPYIFNFIF